MRSLRQLHIRIVSLFLIVLLTRGLDPTPEVKHYEGLLLLQRLAARVRTPWALKVRPECNAFNPTSALDLLPTRRDVDIVAHILASPAPSAIVFDFDNGGGFGSCLHGFLQAFHWAMRQGIPLLILRPDFGNVNAVFGPDGVFECGFPFIDAAVVKKHGSLGMFKPTIKTRQVLSSSKAPFKVATFRSANYVTECLKDALVSPDRRKGPCNERRTAAANYCWQMKVLQALIPCFQPKALAALPSLEPKFVGNFSRVLDQAHAWQRIMLRRPTMAAGLGAFNSTEGLPESAPVAFPVALHVRTLDVAVEREGKFANDIQNADEKRFAENLRALVEQSDFCVFSENRSASSGVTEVFVASDSSALKTLLREKHAGRFAVSFFDSPGDRLKARRGSPISTSQFVTLIEFWLLSANARGLVAMAFFDRSLVIGQPLVPNHQRSVNRFAVSTFAKAAVALAGPDATASFRYCTSLEKGRHAEFVAETNGKIGEGTCSSECDGREVIHSL